MIVLKKSILWFYFRSPNEKTIFFQMIRSVSLLHQTYRVIFLRGSATVWLSSMTTEKIVVVFFSIHLR